MKIKFLHILILFFAISSISFAQEEKDDKYTNADKSTPDFLLEQDTIFVSKKKKKKRKKKTFNKLKTKRGFTTRGSGRGRTDELFFYLKKYKEPSKYITPIYVYDIKKLKLIKLKSYDPKKYPPKEFKIPHGPYTKKKGDMILEEGYFWIGTLHNNWFSYIGEDMIVDERIKYDKGFYEKYKISYYDPANQTIVKEINPFDEFDRNSGIYKYYFESGRIQFVGRLEKGRKIGKWYEYHTNGKKKSEKEYTWNDEEMKEEFIFLNEWEYDGSLADKYVKQRAKEEAEKKKETKAKMKF